MIVPLRLHERLLGLLIFLSAPGAAYRAEDIALAEDLGRCCAQALENARLYAQAIAERDKAEKPSQAKDEFLAILSHELRNPLMPLIGSTRMLRNQPLIGQDPLLAEGVRSMERNARTLERLVGDCLDPARISEGGIRMERKPVELKQIVAASLEGAKDMANAKGLRLDSHIIPDSVLLLGDAIRLEQVIVNLLVNAAKYTDRGGSISVRCTRLGADAEIEVRDTGAGIHPAFLEQIFEPFRRGSDSWLTNRSGLGLGLAIARRIVETHGGRIWAERSSLMRHELISPRLALGGDGLHATVAETVRFPNALPCDDGFRRALSQIAHGGRRERKQPFRQLVTGLKDKNECFRALIDLSGPHCSSIRKESQRVGDRPCRRFR
jgi:hypothetical protein